MSLQFFTADDGVHGREIYVTDGTSGGTKLLKDINPGVGGASIGNQVQSNGVLYFTASDGTATHLWRTDGTTVGTYVLTSSTNGDGSGNLIDVNGTLYFTGSDSTHGSGLFKTDGTVAGTSFVQTVSNPSQFTAVGSTLFFQAYDATNGYELWKSDGTSVGTAIVKDIYPGSSSSSVGNFVASSGKLFFTANDGSTGTELWVSDGTASGTFSIKDINLGAGGSNPGNLFAAGRFVYFFAYDGVHTNFYSTNGAPGNATVLPVTSPVVSSFTRLNNSFCFVASDSAGGQAIYTSDGGNVTRLAHLNSVGSVFYNLGAQLVFYGDDGTHGGGLYSFDGTNTTFLSAVAGGFNTPVVAAGKLFFVSADSAHGSELWVYDGSSVHLTGDVNPGPYDGNIQNISPVQNGVVFTATRPDVGTELFYSDGTAANTGLVADVNMNVDRTTSLSIGSNFFGAGGLTYFSASDGVHGYELWVGDGTATGSHQVVDLVVGASGSNPSNFHSAGGTIYFTADIGDGNGRQLYTSDGTTATRLSNGNAVAGTPYTGDDAHFFVLNGTLYYQGYDSAGVSGYSLFKASPTGITKVVPGYLQGGPILPFGSGVIFQGSDATHGSGLYTFDGTTLTFVATVNDYESPAVSGGKLYFRSTDGNNGSELWVYDGTSVHLTTDLNPGTYSSTPTNITGLGDGRAVFTATAANGDSELYVSDGSASGTALLKDVNPTGNHSPSIDFASQIVASGGEGYFVADGGGLYGNELFVTDGTTAGTHVVKDIIPGSTGSSPGSIYAFGGGVFFTARDGTNSIAQLFYTTGTAASTVELTTSNATAPSSAGIVNGVAQAWFTLGGKFYYGGRDTPGFALYTSDGTASTKVFHLSASINYAVSLGGVEILSTNDGTHGAGLYSFDGSALSFLGAGSASGPGLVAGTHAFFSDFNSYLVATDGSAANTVVVNTSYYSYLGIAGLPNGKVIFGSTSAINGSAAGIEPWVSDGTTTGTVNLGDLMPGTDSSNPQFFTTVGAQVFFAANYADSAGNHGRELFVTDGTPGGTHVVKDIVPGSDSSNPINFFSFNGLLYFNAYDPSTSSAQLWTSDGTDAGTTHFIVPGVDTANPGNFLAVGDGAHFYFTANAGLFYSDGTPGGTTLVTDSGGFDASHYAIVNGSLYFQHVDSVNGYELWKADGATAVRVSDTLLPNGSNQSGFTFVNTAAGVRIFFSANDGTHGQELWVTDGTTAGTQLVKDINVGSGNSDLQHFFVFGGKLYFEAFDSTSNTYKLWVSDGTAAGTQTIGTSDGSQNFYPDNFLARDATHFFFTGSDGLFYSDGTPGGTTLVTGGSGFDASHYAIVNGLLLFQKLDSTNGYELWRSDGTAAGTVRVTDTLVPNGSNQSGFTFVNTAAGVRIFFSANDGTHGQELWVTDGTTADTHLVKDINVGSGDGNPQHFFVFGGKLYFEAFDSTANTYKLWVSDGTAAGTQTIGTSDNSNNFYPDNFLVKDASHFFFTGSDGLFYSDGTTAGTTLVTGTGGFDANHYAVSNGILFFQKNDGANGTEQWRSDGTVAGTYRVTDTYTPISSNPSSFAAIDNLPPTVTNATQTTIGDNQTNHPFQTTVIGDPDLPVQTMTVTITPDDPAKGGFTAASLAATGFIGGGVGGSYTFTGTPAQATAAIQGLVYQPVANRLVVGQSETIGYTVAVNDGAGGSVVNTATTVTQTSINDTPVAGNNSAAVNEDATAATTTRATGLLGNASDVDVGETATLVVSGAHAGTTGTDTTVAASGTTAIHGTYGDLILSADGTYSYIPNSAAAEALPLNAAATETFTYTVADVHGATTTATLTFAITGQNDTPVAVADTASVTEDATVSATTRAAGLLGNDTDVDTGETATLVVTGAHAGTTGTDTAVAASGTTTISGTYGDLVLKADGTYTYSPNNAAAQALPQGQVVTDAFSYTIADVHGASATTTLTFTVTGIDTPAVAVNDVNSVLANATITNATVLANDYDVDGPALKVGSVNGSSAIVDNQVRLNSGALLTLRADGTYDYNPNHAFDYLTGVSGAANSSATDTFTYGLVGGGTATVTITVNGVSTPGVAAKGTSGNDTMVGTSANDYFDLSQGGNDTVSGGAGDDAFYFGAAFTAADTVDGGSGTNNQIGLEGDYTGSHALVLGPTTITNIQVLAALPGHSYDITSNDGNVAAGQTLTIFGGNLTSSDSLTFNGSAETDGHFRAYGGLGADHFVGGALDDSFYFGPAKFNPATDFVDGGGGTNNQLGLDGNYSITLSGSSIKNIQVVALLPGPASSQNNFHLTTDGTLVPSGGQMTIWGATVTTNMSIDGSAETSGNLTIFGGHGVDTLIGGGGNDTIYGGSGGDTLTGGAGHNTFRYDQVSDSTATAQDTITDFKLSDLIDLSRIDANSNTAGRDAFNFIGANAFHNMAGELRYQTVDATHVLVQGDVNGDGVADLSILLNVTDGHTLTSSDFVL